MARLTRLSVAHHVHHVVQRGNNRQAIFTSADDRARMLRLVEEQAARFGVAVHAYVLMDNHFHLLATPSTGDGLPQMMQAVGRQYVRYFNDRNGRTGTLWDGRYRCTVIEPARYLVPCMVYFDTNAVRAGVVAEASQYAWSSHQHYTGLRTDRWLAPPADYWMLGNTPFAREAAYADRVRQGLSGAEIAELTNAVWGGWAMGAPSFIDALQNHVPRRLTPGKAGRPAKSTEATLLNMSPIDRPSVQSK